MSSNVSVLSPPANSPRNVLVLWDFDWSMVNHNTDRYPFHVVWGQENNVGLNKLAQIRESAKQEAKDANKVFNFTEFMNNRGWPMLFATERTDSSGNTKTLSFAEFKDILSNIPIFDENLHVVKTLFQYSLDMNASKNAASSSGSGAEKCEEKTSGVHAGGAGASNGFEVNCEQIIVSNANQVLCDIILRKYGFLKEMDAKERKHAIFGEGNIYTNTGQWRAEQNKLYVRGFHNEDNPHECQYCEPNLCKGSVMMQQIFDQNDPYARFAKSVSMGSRPDVTMKDADASDAKDAKDAQQDAQEKSDSVGSGGSGGSKNVNEWRVGERFDHIDTIIYIGDGANDYCPMSKLRDCDFAFIRKDYALDKLLSKNGNNNEYYKNMKAKMCLWKDGKELLALFRQTIPQANWNMNL